MKKKIKAHFPGQVKIKGIKQAFNYIKSIMDNLHKDYVLRAKKR